MGLKVVVLNALFTIVNESAYSDNKCNKENETRHNGNAGIFD